MLAPSTADHQRWIAALAFAGEDVLAEAWRGLEPPPDYRLLRPVEIGMTLLRGRVGGVGAPFNFGEATITRAAVALATGERGFSYLLGRRPRQAELAAVFHALLQRQGDRALLEERLVRPAAAARLTTAATERAASAATRVDFATVVRGDG
jgi:alpha-D-ribose 1-methylphosphonate 5-triphosphate synthase subunit PhnG